MERSRIALCSALVLALYGCGGGGSSGSVATMSLGVSDAPVDGAQAVNMVFDQVVMRTTGGTDVIHNFEDAPLSIDLLQYPGTASAAVLTKETVPAGDYAWLRLRVINGDSANGSYIEKEGAEYPLIVERKQEAFGDGTRGEIQLDGFSLAADSDTSFVIEFDLRKSIVNPQNNPDEYKLKPRGVRLVEAQEVGAIAGTISQGAMIDCAADNSDAAGHVVYLYPGAVLITDMDDDADLAESDNHVLPLTSATVSAASGSYEIGFVVPGNYSLGYTCLGDKDAPETNENFADDGFKIWESSASFAVSSGVTSVVNLPETP